MTRYSHAQDRFDTQYTFQKPQTLTLRRSCMDIMATRPWLAPHLLVSKRDAYNASTLGGHMPPCLLLFNYTHWMYEEPSCDVLIGCPVKKSVGHSGLALILKAISLDSSWRGPLSIIQRTLTRVYLGLPVSRPRRLLTQSRCVDFDCNWTRMKFNAFGRHFAPHRSTMKSHSKSPIFDVPIELDFDGTSSYRSDQKRTNRNVHSLAWMNSWTFWFYGFPVGTIHTQRQWKRPRHPCKSCPEPTKCPLSFESISEAL